MKGTGFFKNYFRVERKLMVVKFLVKKKKVQKYPNHLIYIIGLIYTLKRKETNFNSKTGVNSFLMKLNSILK